MRTIDLIEMLQDLSKNLPVFVNLDNTILSIISIKQEKDVLYFELSKNISKSLKNWELSLLLNKKKFLTLPIFFVEKNKNRHQIFGLRLDDGKIILY